MGRVWNSLVTVELHLCGDFFFVVFIEFSTNLIDWPFDILYKLAFVIHISDD